MKKWKQFAHGSALTMAAVSLVSIPAVGEETKQTPPDQRSDATYRQGAPLGDRSNPTAMRSALNEKDLAKAKELVGMNIKDQGDSTVGEVKDLVVDLPSGRVLYAVVSSSTLFGGKLATVPVSALSRSADAKHLMLSMDSARFKGAPTFETGQWPDFSDRAYGKQIHGYYGHTPYWEDPPATVAQNRPEVTRDRTAERTTDQATRQELKATAKIHKASEVLGMNVENSQDQNLGEIQDLLVDLRNGRIVYAVLASGGFLGLGEKLLAIPPAAFQASPDGKELVLNADKERLKAAPGFEKNNWPNMADHTWTRNVYSYYGQQPYWDRAGQAGSNREYTQKDADNTGINKRDRDDATLTPADQGGSEADRTLTQQVRRSIVQDDSFSTYAKNIKIITVDGTVTLRGVVQSQTEKNEIETKAKQVAGVTRVDNQLEIKQ